MLLWAGGFLQARTTPTLRHVLMQHALRDRHAKVLTCVVTYPHARRADMIRADADAHA